MTREAFERWLDQHPRTTDALLTVFILAMLGIGGWVDAPLIGVTR
jgi:hypothetical protein